MHALHALHTRPHTHIHIKLNFQWVRLLLLPSCLKSCIFTFTADLFYFHGYNLVTVCGMVSRLTFVEIWNILELFGGKNNRNSIFVGVLFGPTAHWSDSALIRQPVGPTAPWSDSPLVRESGGPRALWSDSPLKQNHVDPIE